MSHSEGLPPAIEVRLDEAGHLVHMEKAPEVNDLIERSVAN